MTVDFRSLSVFTRSVFHSPGCRHLELAESPKTQPAWHSFYRITPPCKICHTAREFTSWRPQHRR